MLFTINSLHAWLLSMLFCRLLKIYKIIFYKKILSGTLSECQTVRIQIRPDKVSGLIWIQIVCKGYQQTTIARKELIDQVADDSGIWETPDVSIIYIERSPR